MRLFKGTYLDPTTGRRVPAARWSLDFTDHLQRRQRIGLAITDRRACEAIGRNVEALVSRKLAGLGPDAELTRWLEVIPGALRDKLAAIGLLSGERAAGGKPLRGHVEDFRQCLLARGNTVKHADLTAQRVRRIFDGCGFTTWTEIAAAAVQRFLAGLRQSERRFSAQSFNHHLRAVKSFCRWMVRERRASEDPLAHLSLLNARTDRRHTRRALTPDEIRRLLETTRNQPTRYGMTGSERALLYLLAVETGLRSNELRNLRTRDFDLNGLTVALEAAYSKHRRQDILPLRPDTAEALRGHLAGRLPTAAAFRMPNAGNVSRMIRLDLLAAAVDTAGVDFHALRHTTASLLASTGANPKVAQSLMRHSTVELTLGCYSHLYKGQDRDALERLPDFTQPVRQQQRATGTDDPEPVEFHSAKTPAKICGNGRTSAGLDGHKGAFLAKVQNAEKQPLASEKPHPLAEECGLCSTTPGRTRTCDLRIRNPLLYPAELRA